MFIGHFAVGFAAKRAAPKASLGTLMGAALLPDLLWPIFVVVGLEQVRIDPGNTAVVPLAFVYYPLSHSLAATAGWALTAAGAFWVATRYRAGAVVVGAAVASHWFLDALTHKPDLPLYPGSATYVGLGLWNSVAGTVAVEGLMFGAGLWLYATGTASRDRIGSTALWAFVALLVTLYVTSLTGPPAPSAAAVAAADLAGFLFVIWAAWLDRHRAWASQRPGAPGTLNQARER